MTINSSFVHLNAKKKKKRKCLDLRGIFAVMRKIITIRLLVFDIVLKYFGYSVLITYINTLFSKYQYSNLIKWLSNIIRSCICGIKLFCVSKLSKKFPREFCTYKNKFINVYFLKTKTLLTLPCSVFSALLLYLVIIVLKCHSMYHRIFRRSHTCHRKVSESLYNAEAPCNWLMMPFSHLYRNFRRFSFEAKNNYSAYRGWATVLSAILLITTSSNRMGAAGASTMLGRDKFGDAKSAQVEVVEGLNATLPCSVQLPLDDAPVLTLWYLGLEETPVYSFDQRPNSNGSGWADPSVFGHNRVVFMPHARPPALHLQDVRREDSRDYRCRVDFINSNSRMAWARLLVIVPTERVDLTVHQSPVMPGSRNDVTCRASGGWPPARIVWLQDGQVVDANYNINVKHGVSYNDLEAGASRGDLLSPFVCQASNNDVTTPLSTTYTRNVTFGPLSVLVEVSSWPQVEGVEVFLKCTVVGSNPPASVKWYQHSRLLTRGTVNVTRVGDVTVSVLRLIPTRDLHGRQIVCRAENPMVIRPAVEDIVTLDVSYRPNATATLVWPHIARNLQEGTKLLIQCHVDANPAPYKFAWLHNGVEMRANESSGLVLTTSILTLHRATREWSGAYQCAASNVEGDSTSNTVIVNIKYAPRCMVSQSIRGLSFFEPTIIQCKVDADPDNVTFRWILNAASGKERIKLIPEEWYTSHGLQSTLKYVAEDIEDFGVISCEATNAVGGQAVGCKTTLVSVGPPEEVRGCMVTNMTSTSLTINCISGFDGGLKQRFQLQVWQSNTEALVFTDTLESGSATKYSNTTRHVDLTTIRPGRIDPRHQLYNNIDREYGRKNEDNEHYKYPIFSDRENFQPERIQFFVPTLQPNVDYFAAVTSINSRGHAKPKKFQLRTLPDGTEPPSSPRPRPKSTSIKKIDQRLQQTVTVATSQITTNTYIQGLPERTQSPKSRLFLWVMAVVLGVGLAVFGVGAGVYFGRRQIITCWYLSCGRFCRACCSGSRSGGCCGRCIGCWKRCKANCEDCILQRKSCCTIKTCKDQLVACVCLRKACSRMRTLTESKCCRRIDKDDDGADEASSLVCCMELCKKNSVDKEAALDTATGLSGPALQLHRGGTLLLRRALSSNDSTSGSIKRGKDSNADGDGNLMNGMLEQTIYDSSGKYRGFAHISSQMQVGIRHTPEAVSEAAPNSASASDPLLVNGKKLSFKEPSRGREDAGNKSVKETSKQTLTAGDRTITDLNDTKDNTDAENYKDSAGDEPDEADKPRAAPKFSTVLRNFRPPSLAKFVPKGKSSTTPGCDV